MKRIISVLLTITMMFCITTSIPLSASATTTDKVESNDTYTDQYGSWTYELTDSGNGYKITDYSGSVSDVEIPNAINNISVLEIGDCAFYSRNSLTSITIPNSVTSIGISAFNGCNSLTSITIPDSVTSIGSWAFEDCRSLSDVYYTGSESQWNNISIGSSGNSYLTNANIHYNSNSYTDQYGSWTYELTDSGNGYKITDYSGSVSDVEIPNAINNISVLEIGDSAFYSRNSLTSITIPDSVTSIGNYAFSGCSSLTSITIPDSVTSIGIYAFSDCSSLTSITIPNSVTTIGRYAFYYCDSLTSITIPDSVTSIGSDAFYKCRSLTSITIPDSVTSIGDYAFSDCSSLTSITIPNSVTSIGSWVFYNCSSLTSITIPNSVTSIGGYAFYKCRSLTSITIPDSVTSIGISAFNGCKSLTSITIPNSVTTIGRYAFYKCSSLSDVYYTGSESQWNNISIDSGNSYLTNANIHFKEYKTGDLSGDDIISIKDVLYLMKYLVGDMELTDSQIVCADVNDDGELTLADAVMIQKAVLGILEIV